MTTIATAIERQNWEVVALCLLQGLVQVASRLPPETLHHLLEALEGESNGPDET
ncbi:MAG: hypothetical protein HW388_28 [Dehalococcoidia bacterium]|nr:hypothetical protein [Dehalococcoidia bacterium]